MEVTVDITKYRVQPFKSYKVCVSLDDPSLSSFINPTCTHLFSFERAVPYVPTIKKTEEAVSAKLSTEKQSKKSENESEVEEESENESDLRSQEEERRGSELQRVLEDTRHFVRDDFSKVERALEEPFLNKGTNLGSAKGFFLTLGIVLMLL